MFENRDYGGSTHFFRDISSAPRTAFFDLPGLRLGAYAGYWAASITSPSQSAREVATAQGNLERRRPLRVIDHSSMYFNDPDGARLELISDPLGAMYGKPVG
jgi:hypothetical protein